MWGKDKGHGTGPREKEARAERKAPVLGAGGGASQELEMFRGLRGH